MPASITGEQLTTLFRRRSVALVGASDKSLASAASTARSAQPILGLGLPRRSTATSCRRIRISAFFDAEDRADSASHDSNVARER